MNFINGRVTNILEDHETITKVLVEIDGKPFKAINYKILSGDIKVGDLVKVNTTAMDLSLGTGGYHYVISNNSNTEKEDLSKGHIMKLRYTPLQMNVLSMEEEDSPFHHIFNEREDIDGHIVLIGTLHSMLAPLGVALKYMNEDIKINYIMTEGAALALDFSDSVRQLKALGIINKTITIGNSFGGDYECVNMYTALIASKWILDGDITIIAMGPGIVGTASKFGFTGIEQGEYINTVNNLKAYPIAVPRISFADKRERHYGISHQTITTLTKASNSKGIVVFPRLKSYHEIICRQIVENKIDDKHHIVFEDGDYIEKAFLKYGINPKTMGRSIAEDREYFLGLGAVAKYGYDLFMRRKINDFSRENYEI